MTHALIVTAAAVLLTGATLVILGFLTAPDGYEDDDGFHYGAEPIPPDLLAEYREHLEAEARRKGRAA